LYLSLSNEHNEHPFVRTRPLNTRPTSLEYTKHNNHSSLTVQHLLPAQSPTIMKNPLPILTLTALLAATSLSAQSIVTTGDVFIRADNPDTNTSGSEMIIGSNNADPFHGLMTFDLSSLSGSFSDASLSLTVSRPDSSGSADTTAFDLDLRELLVSYTSTEVTWNDRSSGTPWATPGGAIGTEAGSTVLDSQSISSGDAGGTEVLFDSTDLLTLINNNVGGSIAFMITPSSTTGTTRQLAFFDTTLSGAGSQGAPTLNLTAIPEPSAFALIGGTLALALVFPRRRR